jgi:mannose-1-phosphate guanylyltransferase
VRTVDGIKGIIMAGGEGKRFRPLSYYFQKCMIPVGEEEKPILEYIIRLFSYHNIRDLILLVGYKHEQIVNYFNRGERFGVDINYLRDPPGLKGSANALLNAYEKGGINDSDTIIIYYGDIVSNINLGELSRIHSEKDADATIALATSFKMRVGTADVENGRITRFIEKPTLQKPVSIGILALKGSTLKILKELQNAGDLRIFDLMGDFIPYLVEEGDNVHAYLTDSFWYDIGSIERYERLENQELGRELGYLFQSPSISKYS